MLYSFTRLHGAIPEIMARMVIAMIPERETGAGNLEP